MARSPCILAYYHHPPYSSGLHGSYQSMEPFLGLALGRGTDVVLSAHDHDYERFRSTATDATFPTRDEAVRGGTGGRCPMPFGKTEGPSQVSIEGDSASSPSSSATRPTDGSSSP
jgi:hypothetical protein